jgi:hypothetical protein
MSYVQTDWLWTDTNKRMTKDRPDFSSERVDRSWMRWRGPATRVNYRPVLLQNNKSATVIKKMSRRKKNWSRVPDGGLTPRLTGRLTVGRNVTSTSNSLYTFGIRCYDIRTELRTWIIPQHEPILALQFVLHEYKYLFWALLFSET